MARPREFDEETVVRAARERFWNAGYAATSMTDLAEATGLGKTSLYGAFGDKHALFMRIFDEYSTGAVRNAEAALGGADDGAFERIRAYLLANAGSSACNPHGCLLARGTAELANVDEEVAERAHRAYEGISLVIAGAVQGAQRAGDVDPEADPRVLGDLVLALHRGTEALGRAGTGEPELRALVEAFLAGLRRSRPASALDDGAEEADRGHHGADGEELTAERESGE